MLIEVPRNWRNTIRFVRVWHAEAAVLMAIGGAKSTGKLGACFFGQPGHPIAVILRQVVAVCVIVS